MLNGLKTLIIVPLLLCWSMAYGVLGGMFFQLLAAGEHLLAQNRQQIMMWKRYPQRSNRQYANILFEQQMRHRDIGTLPFAYNQVQTHPVQAPFPVLALLSNTLVAALWLPVALLQGALQGPAFVYGNLRRRQAAHLSQAQG
jgi:uncharacterized protein YneF (UPF0154 family)